MKAFVSGKPYWWQWPTILSLDAPAVALLWQWLFAQVAGVALGFAPVFVLGTSVWLAYAADRWIEGWRLVPAQVRTQRHHFYQRWRWPLASLWLLVLAADLACAFRALPARAFDAGLFLLLPVLAYLLSHQLAHRHHPWRAPKELCIALLLAGGVVLFPAAAPHVVVTHLIAPLALFASLCFANCALISVWEHAVDQSHGQTSLALQFRRATSASHALPWVIAISALLFTFFATGPARVAGLCALASGLLLGGVDRLEPRCGRQLARVLADLALMTPLLPLVLSAL